MKYLGIVFLVFFSVLINAQPLNNIVVFGDSLSDNGNLYEYMHQRLPQSPPYYEGRFSNGPIWVENLIKTYFPISPAKHLFNFAFGGAGISENPEEDLLFTLKKEIDAYLLANQGKAQSDSLFIIWIGANNYLGIPDDFESTLKAVNAGISHELLHLVKAGAKQIVLVNLPDLGRTPMAYFFNLQEKLSFLTKQHNALLAKTFKTFKEVYPEVNWFYFEANKIFHNLVTYPENYGFNNVTGSCYEMELDTPSNKTILQMSALAKYQIKNPCDGFLFFDPIHPTELAHKIMSEEAKSFLDSAGIEFIQ